MITVNAQHNGKRSFSLSKLSVYCLFSVFSCSSSLPSSSTDNLPRDYVLAYPDMPKEGVRPIDLNGVMSGPHAIHPCIMPFLKREFRDLGLPTSYLRRVRFHAASKPLDALNEIAFSKRFRAITRDQDIYVDIPLLNRTANFPTERLFFHELVHTAQFKSGNLTLSSYAVSSIKSFASGKGPHDNRYENHAIKYSEILDVKWNYSQERKNCYPDIIKPFAERRIGKRDDVIVLYAVWNNKDNKYLPYSMQF